MGWLGGGGGGAAATYALSAAGVVSVDEGKSITVTLTTTNLGTAAVAYTISGVTINDFMRRGQPLDQVSSLTGNFNVVNNTASITFGIIADSINEAGDIFTIGIDGQTTTVSVAINDLSTASYTRLGNGARIAGNAGPGGVYDAYGYLMPLKGRALGLINNSGKDLFIPTRTQAEMTSVYNNLNIGGVTVFKGDYIFGGRLWKNQIAWTDGPCYSYIPIDGETGSYIPLAQSAPPAVDSGYTDGGITSGWTSPLDFRNANGTVQQANIGWMFYMTTTWGCAVPGYPYLFANVRYGYVEF